ncbi:hypothetical protein [Sandaracinus amylolyticus]|uniref:hypothetical protein n=1 Tax=Sandaracinus amylolyticus TaxID=927083 RepID=UPI001F2D6DD6|nr:hypothetical protein [Sandaracinus amylolyticus]UJR79643.1 Hypothetical protein I5071_16810 [Sandaracinus amylolyticus]
MRKTVIVGALLFGACQGTGADPVVADLPAGDPVPIDLSHRGSARSRADLTCELTAPEDEVDAFFATRTRVYVVAVGREDAGEEGVFGVYDEETGCAAECLVVCEDRWICSTLQCGERDAPDGDPDQMNDELEDNGFPVPGREPRGDEPREPGGGGDGPFDPPDPGPMPPGI